MIRKGFWGNICSGASPFHGGRLPLLEVEARQPVFIATGVRLPAAIFP
jgi:hypothetical protein